MSDGFDRSIICRNSIHTKFKPPYGALMQWPVYCLELSAKVLKTHTQFKVLVLVNPPAKSLVKTIGFALARLLQTVHSNELPGHYQ